MTRKMIFSSCPDAEFFGRGGEITRVVDHARLQGPAPGQVLVGPRWSGKSEILRRAHARLFWEGPSPVPVYFRFRTYPSVEHFASDYIRETLKQYIAFVSRDPELAASEVPFSRLESLMAEREVPGGLALLVRRHREAVASGDRAALLGNAVSAPARVSSVSGTGLFMLLDDLHLADAPEGVHDVAAELVEALGAGVGFAASAPSATALNASALAGRVESMAVGGLDTETASFMLSELLRGYGVGFDPDAVSLAARKLEGNPMYLRSLARSARAGGEMTGLRTLAELYAREVAGGSIAVSLRSALSGLTAADLRVVGVVASSPSPATVEGLAAELGVDRARVESTVVALAEAGLAESDFGAVSWTGGAVAADFVGCVAEVGLNGRAIDEVRTRLVRDFMREAWGRRGRAPEGEFSGRVADTLKMFDGQEVPDALFQNRAFSERRKDGIKGGLAETVPMELPQVVGCFAARRWERGETGPAMYVAQGFEHGRYDSGNEVVWLAGVKEGPRPVNVGDVENYLRRSAILATRFRSVRLARLMAGESGFTSEALERAEAEGVMTLAHEQLSILGDTLAAPAGSRERVIPDREYEVVLPSSSRAELMAARAAEEITTEMGFGTDSIAAVKTALVEACINAFEHGGNRATRVRLRFITGPGRLEIRVENTGATFSGGPGAAAGGEDPSALPRKRGWGLKLIRSLMDEVRFEGVEGGARVVMVKYLTKQGDEPDDSER